ncbi:hypothetical protein C8Q76DRAFT_584098, partial [Earliella scabrosa]
SAPPQTIPPHLAQYIEEAVQNAMHTHYGPRDYALAVDGGRIVPELTSCTLELPRAAGSKSSSTRHPAEVVLRHNLHGGRCWQFEGNHGQVGIYIPHVIHPTHITVDYVPQKVADDPGQAPRRMRLWGALDGRANQGRQGQLQRGVGPPMQDIYTFMHIANFTFNLESPHHSQTFPVDPKIFDARINFGVFVVEVFDNWGSDVTCIYRLRIHG